MSINGYYAVVLWKTLLVFCYTHLHTLTVTGLTVNDTVITNALMTVPINAPGFGSDLHLCYQIHGTRDKYLNLVSDECTSVNAHYAQAPRASFITIIDSVSLVAVDNGGSCHQISVDAMGCSVTLDGKAQQVLSVYEENGISVRSYTSRVRISVPNCADNTLAMWIMCQSQSFYNPFTNSRTEPVNMIKFEITRGLNLKESSHGLLGRLLHLLHVCKSFM